LQKVSFQNSQTLSKVEKEQGMQLGNPQITLPS